MARTYDLTALNPVNPSSSAWALAWLRAALRDTPNDVDAFPTGGWHDEELQSALSLDAVTDPEDDAVYYRPHVTAAGLIAGDPTRVLSFTAGGYGETYETGDALSKAILKRGKAIDDLISDTTDGRLAPESTTFTVVF